MIIQARCSHTSHEMLGTEDKVERIKVHIRIPTNHSTVVGELLPVLCRSRFRRKARGSDDIECSSFPQDVVEKLAHLVQPNQIAQLPSLPRKKQSLSMS